MAVKICLNRARGTMTSANWKVIDRPCQQSGLRRFSVPFSRTGLLYQPSQPLTVAHGRDPIDFIRSGSSVRNCQAFRHASMIAS